MAQQMRVLGFAGIVGGIGSVVYAYIFAHTHGTTTVNFMKSFLGLDEVAWGRIAIVIPVLLWAGLTAFRLQLGTRISRISLIGYRIASAALALRIFSEIPQLFLNMRTEYLSPIGLTSWYIYLVSVLLLTIGMLVLGIGCRRAGLGKWTFYAPLFIGLLIIPTIAVSGVLAEVSDDSMIYLISAGLLHIPQGLAWVVLSIVSLTPWTETGY